jgi:hypothetical protein
MVHNEHVMEEIEVEDGSCRLTKMELEQRKFNYQRQLITEAQNRLNNSGVFNGMPGGYATAGTGGTELQPLMSPLDYGGSVGMAPLAQQAQLERAMSALNARERSFAENIGRERAESLLADGSGEYLSLINRGEFKQVCVVCRARREMRSHHCKECGRCVHRLDHHCPWINNCVGLGNQRAFYCFIVILLCTILCFYYVVVLYAIDAVLPEWHDAMDNIASMFTKFQWGPEIFPMIVLIIAAFDLIWAAFVGALVARHSAHMSVNITTYEVLVRPPHVVRRFPKNRGRFWFLDGFGVADCFRNWASYWTLDMEYDASDFAGSAPPESFVAGSPLDIKREEYMQGTKETGFSVAAPAPPMHYR